MIQNRSANLQNMSAIRMESRVLYIDEQKKGVLLNIYELEKNRETRL